jgi:hypothetical protein
MLQNSIISDRVWRVRVMVWVRVIIVYRSARKSDLMEHQILRKPLSAQYNDNR